MCTDKDPPACEHDGLIAQVDRLQDRNANVTVKDNRGATLPHTVAAHGSEVELFAQFIDAGADVDTADSGGLARLMNASCCAFPRALPDLEGGGYDEAHSVAIVMLPLEQGADRLACSFDGETACGYAEVSNPAIDDIRSLVCR